MPTKKRIVTNSADGGAAWMWRFAYRVQGTAECD